MIKKTLLNSPLLRCILSLFMIAITTINASADDGYYQQCTALSDIENNGTYIIVISDGTTYYAINQDSENNVIVNPESDGTLKNPSSSIIWTANSTTTANGFNFVCNSKYINHTSNTYISTVGSSKTTWVISKLSEGTNTFKIQETYTTGRYIGWGGSNFKAYVNSNFKNQFESGVKFGQYSGALYIYKKVNNVPNYDNKIITLKCIGNTQSTTNAAASSTFTQYVYNNNDAIGVTTTPPTNQRSYDFIMHAATNGTYTFQSLTNNSLYLGLNTYDNLYLSSTPQEFSLTKWSDASGATESDTKAVAMDGYALQSKRINTTGNDSILVAITNTGDIEITNYTSQSYGSNYSSTDFTIQICKYVLTPDGKNVHLYGTNVTDDDIDNAYTFLGSAKNDNSLIYVEADNDFSSATHSDNIIVNDGNSNYTCANFVLTDKVDISIPIAFTATSATYSRNIGTTPTWGTICLPYSAKANGMTFYTLKQESDKTDGTGTLTFIEVSNPEANVPYVFKTNGSETEGIYSIYNDNCNVKKTTDENLDNTSAGWTLKGLYARTTVGESESVTMPSTASDIKIYDANSFYIKSNKFYKINNTFTSSAFRAYFSAPTSAAKISLFTISQYDATTSLNTLLNPYEEVLGYYNTNGIEQNGIRKGINIIKYKSGKVIKAMIK